MPKPNDSIDRNTGLLFGRIKVSIEVYGEIFSEIFRMKGRLMFSNLKVNRFLMKKLTEDISFCLFGIVISSSFEIALKPDVL